MSKDVAIVPAYTFDSSLEEQSFHGPAMYLSRGVTPNMDGKVGAIGPTRWMRSREVLVAQLPDPASQSSGGITGRATQHACRSSGGFLSCSSLPFYGR